MEKRNVSFVVTLGLVLTFGTLLHANVILLPFERHIEAKYIEGLNDDRVFVGASHHILVGKVLKRVGQTESDNAPLSTQFDVQIVSNIKGDLTGVVRMSQEGGYVNGIKTTVEGQSLLTVGSTYILSARTDGQGTYMVSSYPRGVILLSADRTLTADALLLLAENSGDVLALRGAYIHEIPLAVDVANERNYNSYTAQVSE